MPPEPMQVEEQDEQLSQSLYGFEFREPDLRRKEGSRDPVHNIKQLWQSSHEILGHKLQGMSNVDIAELMGVSPQTVSYIVNSDLGKQKLSTMRQERDKGFVTVAQRVTELEEKAMKVYEEIFDSETASLTLKKQAADTITMDLGGHRSPTKIDTRSMSTTISMAELEEFKARGIEAAKNAGMLVVLPDEE